MENEQVRTLDKLNNARTSRIEEVPSLQVGRIFQLLAISAGTDRSAIHFNVQTFQSTLRELEKKIELERVQYEEYMLELTLTKKVNKSSKVFQLPSRNSNEPYFY